MKRWLPLVALATAQFVMVLDQSVMNVSISQLVEDFDTTVTTIQAVITLYCLVMAMFMLTGGKIGDIIGRRRAFVIGLVIYACGSALTAVAPTVAVLTLGWSILEGIGAALVLPAHGRADRRQLRGRRPQGRLRGDRRGRRRRHRGRADPRWVGHDRAVLAGRVRRRGRARRSSSWLTTRSSRTPSADGPSPGSTSSGSVLAAAGLGVDRARRRCSRARGAG